MKLYDKLHMIIRLWRYRLRTESESIKFLLEQHIKGSVAIDVGANRGIYTYWLSKQVGDSGKVFSFEPQPELIPDLEDLKETFFLANATIVNKGLSSKNDTLILYRNCVGCGGASLIVPKDEKLSVPVELIKLDDYFTENPILPLKISFIKADVEGHEIEVFKGARETLLEHKPILLFECHEREAIRGDLFNYLGEFGYRGFFFNGNQMVDADQFQSYPYRKPTERHRNYIFV